MNIHVQYIQWQKSDINCLSHLKVTQTLEKSHIGGIMYERSQHREL